MHLLYKILNVVVAKMVPSTVHKPTVASQNTCSKFIVVILLLLKCIKNILKQLLSGIISNIV